jgi:hypothetical protein
MTTDIEVQKGRVDVSFPAVRKANPTIWLPVMIVLLIAFAAGSTVLTTQAPVSEAADKGYSLEAWTARYYGQADAYAANEAARPSSRVAQSALYEGLVDLYAANEAARQRGIEAWAARYQGQADLLAAQQAPQQRGFDGGGGHPVKKD